MIVTELLEKIEPLLPTLSESDRAMVDSIMDCVRVGMVRPISRNEKAILLRVYRSTRGSYTDVSHAGVIAGITIVSSGTRLPYGELA